ncbi:type VII secretion protein EccE [Mycobacterium sp. MYCO198283]|uniref:type VII secretion protein EccE n=1 Tax=Mycobacterium sp. MYCO198283 TaxID=2883505 RepID=UPI001E5C5BE3|nr:type VII secretion protein EccE [Mycobacterium sp. MYCO198283]MCG5433053.1 type VII secretion protein EccE [Mycobacterium sp. MYCO198283]
MKARPVEFAAPVGAVIAVEVLVLVAALALAPADVSWYPLIAVALVAVLLLFLRVHRRTPLGWLAAVWRWRRRRGRLPVTVAAALDIPHGSALCGVRTVDGEAITMIAVAGQPYAATALTGSANALTTNLLPMDVLADSLDQPGGVRLAGIDVVSSGVRVRRGTGYPPLYSTLLADRPAAGQRTTRLIVRLDTSESLGGLVYRTSVGATAAAATERIVNALLQRGVRARPLTAKELDTALTELGAGMVAVAAAGTGDGGEAAAGDEIGQAGWVGMRPPPPPPPRERWHTIAAHPGYLTTYWFSPEDITTTALNQLWALRSDEVVVTVAMRKDRSPVDDRVKVAALVRLNDPQPPSNPPNLYLNTLPGDQQPAAVRCLPAERSYTRLPERPLDDVGLDIPVGPSGVMVGTTATGDLLLLPLTDPEQATRIHLRTGTAYTRQLLIRAAAVGERIAVYTDNPRQWAGLAQPLIAIVDRHHPPEFVPTILVSDRRGGPPPAGLASTVITLGEADRMSAPDIAFVQTSPSTVRITTAAFTTDVNIATFKAEQPFLGEIEPPRSPRYAPARGALR